MINFDNLGSAEAIAALISVIGAFTSGIGGFIVWKYKETTQKKMNEELETHKSELENKKIEIQNIFDTQIERLRVEYSSLYEKRVSTIEKIYSILYDIGIIKQEIQEHLFHYSEEEYTSSKNMEIYVDKLTKELNKFVELFNKNKIYFPTTSVNKISAFISLIENFYDKYQFYKDEHDGDIEGFMLEGYSVLFPNDFKDIITILENDFRILIGEKN